MRRNHHGRDELTGVLRRNFWEGERAKLTPDDIDELMIKTIARAIVERGSFTKRDLIGANVPAHALTASRIARCLEVARRRDPAIDSIVGETS